MQNRAIDNAPIPNSKGKETLPTAAVRRLYRAANFKSETRLHKYGREKYKIVHKRARVAAQILTLTGIAASGTKCKKMNATAETDPQSTVAKFCPIMPTTDNAAHSVLFPGSNVIILPNGSPMRLGVKKPAVSPESTERHDSFNPIWDSVLTNFCHFKLSNNQFNGISTTHKTMDMPRCKDMPANPAAKPP